MANFVGKRMNPSSDDLIEEVSRVVVNVHPVKPASDQPVLMCVERLEDFMEVVGSEDLFSKDPSFFALAITSPGSIFLSDAIMSVHCKVPVSHDNGESSVCRLNIFARETMYF